MDPDAALVQILDAASAIQADTTDDLNGPEATALADLVMGLHGWITRGGFLPAAWRATAGATPFHSADPDEIGQLQKSWEWASQLAFQSIGQPDRDANVAYRDELAARLRAAKAGKPDTPTQLVKEQ